MNPILIKVAAATVIFAALCLVAKSVIDIAILIGKQYGEPQPPVEQPQQPTYLEPAAVNGNFYIPSIHLSGFVNYLNYHGHDIKTMPPDMLRIQWRYYLQEISIED